MINKLKQFFKSWTQCDKWSVVFMLFLVLAIYLCRFIPVPHWFSRAKAEPVVVEVKAAEKVFCYDPLVCIRDVGELNGWDNQLIMEMIRIARAESKCDTQSKDSCIPDNGVSGVGLDPEARNPNSTATGIFQILSGTWQSNHCTGERTNFVDNIWCGWKIRKASGNGPWISSSNKWQ